MGGRFFFFFSSRRRHTRWNCDWSSDVCSSDLAHRLDEQAPVGIAGHDAGASLAPLEQAFAGVEEQSSFDLLRLLAVAFVAIVGEDRANPALEEIKLRARLLRPQSTRTQDSQRDPNCGSRPLHAMMPLTTLPATSVRRKSRPLYR